MEKKTLLEKINLTTLRVLFYSMVVLTIEVFALNNAGKYEASAFGILMCVVSTALLGYLVIQKKKENK